MPPLTKPKLGATCTPTEPLAERGWVFVQLAALACTKGARELGLPLPPLSQPKHKDGWQGSIDMAPFTPYHGGSHPCCSKCQAANGLSCILAEISQKGEETVWKSKAAEKRIPDLLTQNRITEYPCHKDASKTIWYMFLVTVPGCRNCSTVEQSLFAFSNFFLVVSNLDSGFQRDAPHCKLSDLNTYSLKTNYHLLLVFCLQEHHQQPQHLSVRAHSMLSASRFSLFSTERLLPPAHGYTSQCGLRCS